MIQQVKKKILRFVTAALLLIAAIVFCSGTVYARSEQPGTEFNYYGDVVVSAYYPAEDAEYPNNYRGIPLADLVGEIVAAPTGSDLIGKTIIIVYDIDDEIEYLLRKVEDTGCMDGRIDLLVADAAAMRVWGLKQASIYVIEEATIIPTIGGSDYGQY